MIGERLPIIHKVIGPAMMAASLFFLLQPASAGVKISLNLKGGWATLAAKDVNAGTRAISNWGQSYLPVFWSIQPVTVSRNDLKPVHAGYELGGDVIFAFSRFFGIGIGAGYLTASGTSGLGLGTGAPLGGATAGVYSETRLSAIPVRIGLFLTLPLSGRLHIIGNAGPAYFFKARYSGSWVAATGVLDALGPQTEVTTLAEKKTGAFGFMGGLGLEYEIFSGLAVLIEARGRYAKFQGLSGTSVAATLITNYPGDEIIPPFSERGKLYDDSAPTIPDAPHVFLVQTRPPSGMGGAAREAVVDFTGIGLQAGVRIRF